MKSSPVQFTVSGITARLFELILEMSEEKQRELFIFIGDQRQYARQPYMMSVEYKTGEGTFQAFILDVSAGGTFIETGDNLFVGQKLTLSFPFRNAAEPFIITGSVVWKSKNGAGVKFIFDSLEHQERFTGLIQSL